MSTAVPPSSGPYIGEMASITGGAIEDPEVSSNYRPSVPNVQLTVGQALESAERQATRISLLTPNLKVSDVTTSLQTGILTLPSMRWLTSACRRVQWTPSFIPLDACLLSLSGRVRHVEKDARARC